MVSVESEAVAGVCCSGASCDTGRTALGTAPLTARACASPSPAPGDRRLAVFSGGVPINVCRTGVESITSPASVSNRVTSVRSRWGPLVSSKGSQKLYECPIFDWL